MGYTHYVKRPRVLAAAPFKQVVADTKVIIEALTEYGIKLAGPDGTGSPILKPNLISLNGQHDCGHAKNSSIVIPWPCDDAGGVAEPGQNAVSGEWFAGTEIEARICNGSCDYETFQIPRIFKPESWQDQDPDANGQFFDCCKTAFRPYDLAVIAILLVFKKHFGDAVNVSSDGTDQQWFDGKLLCTKLLDYGFEFEINKGGELGRKAERCADTKVARNERRDATQRRDATL